jgi:hypothetical protein
LRPESDEDAATLAQGSTLEKEAAYRPPGLDPSCSAETRGTSWRMGLLTTHDSLDRKWVTDPLAYPRIPYPSPPAYH